MSPSHVQPWHQVMELREEIRTGDLSLAFFAADLTKAVMGEGPMVYRDPLEFFALTYPTANLKKLARDVVLRLAGESDKAVRQLELTYGGGKTHTLLTLYHLVRAPSELPEHLPAVQEFVNSIGRRPPNTRVGFVGFDKLDPKLGVAARSPEGEVARFLYPWNVLAWQLAGAAGLDAIGSSVEEERDSPPFENVLGEGDSSHMGLFRLVRDQGDGILILLDEVLMWAVEKVREDEGWLDTLQTFFQSLSQAVAATKGAAMVVSLLASDPRFNEGLGRRVALRLSDVLRREQEEPIQPVEKKDVSEVLRRRLFTAASYSDTSHVGPNVSAAVAGIVTLDEDADRLRGDIEAALRASYPFDPNLTEVLYHKWTQISGFQRTRGVLRTFALALRDSAMWDDSPVIGPGVFLAAPGESDLSESLREMVDVANKDEVEGRRQDWRTILQGEMDKAREAQGQYALLRHREVEQAVVATFLHSQPVGQKAVVGDLFRLLGQNRPDRIQLCKALTGWARTSWFLDEEGVEDKDDDGLPRTWRLGAAPNLKQMHDQWCDKVRGEVDAYLGASVGKVKSLFDAAGTGARVHKFPASPGDITDDTDFHFLVLGLSAASDPDKPSAAAVRYIEQTTTAERGRRNTNLIVVGVPSKVGLDTAREAVAEYLAWQRVAIELKDQDLDAVRKVKLETEIKASEKAIPDRIRQAWCVGVTLDKTGKARAWQVTPDSRSLLGVFKADKRFRIQDGAVNAEAMLPGGPYDVWTRGRHTERYLRDVVEAFAQWPELPKVLRTEAVRETMATACREGLVVLRMRRPDGSYRTWWREEPADTELREREMQVVLPENAELSSLLSSLVAPGGLPGLWDGESVDASSLYALFAGGEVVMVPAEGGFEEPRAIPRADDAVVTTAVTEAVAAGKVWLLEGAASLWKEPVPQGLAVKNGKLRSPPALIPPDSFTDEALPEAWTGGETTAGALAQALSTRSGVTLPWPRVGDDINGAISARVLARAGGDWPCDWDQADQARFKVPSFAPPPPPPPTPPKVKQKPGGTARMSPTQLTLLAEAMPALTAATAEVGVEMEFVVTLELPLEISDELIAKLNEVLEDEGVELKLRRQT